MNECIQTSDFGYNAMKGLNILCRYKQELQPRSVMLWLKSEELDVTT